MMYLLALTCPPLAVLLTGSPARAAANVGLTCLLYVPGAAHAVGAVARYRNERRNEALLAAVAQYYARRPSFA